jgi:hypothetical protein
MKTKFAGACVAVLVLACALFATVPFSCAQDATCEFYLVNQNDGTFSYTLNVVVPQSLVAYYESQNHRSATDGDFPKFVTPYVVQPIADALRQIYPNDENFTNGVLTLVHQIPYVETVPEFYPVETLVRNEGDCDIFSLLAASILEAGGLQVVLLHYVNKEHMNIGVHLDSSPQNARSGTYSVESKGITYYIAECTSNSWKSGWRVGECPDDLQNQYPNVIQLGSDVQVSPGQVSASFKKLSPVTLTLSVSPPFALAGSTLTITGQISPSVADQNITLYESNDGSSWTVICITQTQTNGQFTYSWSSPATGKLDIRASWTGNDQYAGTTSQPQSTLIVPLYFVALIGLTVVAVVLCVVAFVVSSRRRKAKQQLPTTFSAGASSV